MTTNLTRRDALKTGVALTAGAFFASGLPAAETKTLPKATYDKLPASWKGFNLLEKFNGRNDRFVEDDFRWIRDFGFNFVRLPMDYRGWIVDGDWRKIDEKVLEHIDEAVRFGEKYGVHVNVNFHRAPGYTVAHPPEAKSVWTDPEALEVCTLHWKAFARRYKGVSNDRVSFNLFNEPAIDKDLLPQCIAAHRAIIRGIREEDPERLIICDGSEWGNRPFFELVDEKIGQATRGYAPNEISHYQASWMNSKDFPYPTWPMVSGEGTIYSPGQSGIEDRFKGFPLSVEGPFPAATRLRVRVGTVSGDTDFAVTADGKTLFEHKFRPGPGQGEWKEVVFKPEWNIYQNNYDRDYEVDVPAGTKTLELKLTGGQWLVVQEIGLKSDKQPKETVVRCSQGWNQEPSSFRYAENAGGASVTGGDVKDRDWLRKRLDPWVEVRKQGSGVLVGEFGAFSPCPHDVTLRWMGDMVANWRELGFGFALWNFRGAFGILDSGRKDVDYEDFHGHKLDRKMLELLQG